MVQQLPTRLGKSPLIEAVFEIRLETGIALSQILSGILYSSLGCTSIERLPQSDIPDFVRNQDPNLKYVALSRLKWDQYSIHVGDNSLGLSTGYPYPGWEAFRARINRLLEITNQFDFIKSVERFALKYIDLFPSSEFVLADQHFSIDLKISDIKLDYTSTTIRTELQSQNTIHIIQLIGEATGHIQDLNETRVGVILDIDSIQNSPGLKLASFLQNANASLNELHQKNKKLFFNMLSPDGLNKLEPSYE